MKKKITNFIVKSVFLLEAFLAFFIIFGVIVGSIDLVRYFRMIYETPPLQTFSLLQTFLGHALLLVVGLELVIMLVRHTPSSIVEVLLYATARKIIIETKSTWEIFLGIIAIGVIFAINRIFAPGKSFSSEGVLVNSAMPVEEVNRLANVNIPMNLGNTIGGVIFNLANEEGKVLKEKDVFYINDAEVTIISMEENLIKNLLIKKIKDGED